MKRAILFLTLIILAVGASAQEKNDTPAKPQVTTRDYRNRVFEIKHRDPNLIASAVRLLGSGFVGAELSVNSELRTLTVRDFPENIASIEEAIRRLDQPVSGQPEVEFHVYVLIGSTTPITTRDLPTELVDVVKELQTTLRYSSYGLMTSSVHRTRPGNGIESSGVAEAKLLGLTNVDVKPIFYKYFLRRITVPQGAVRDSVDVENFRFEMNIPLLIGTSTQYQNVGFDTPVVVREGEKVVVGTTTMGDKALIVVVTAAVEQAPPKAQ